MAGEKHIEFEQVVLMVGSAPKAIHLSLGEIRISAGFIEKELSHLQTLVGSDVPVVMTFKKVYTPTGHDLEQFARHLGIEIGHGEVEQ
jgi:4-diphosphocytidyl-2C-methyl-D-erythritol kinase